MSADIGTPAERVARGVAWLDANVGAGVWEARIVLRDLNISRPCKCVLGQVFESDAVSAGNSSGFVAAKIRHRELYDAIELPNGACDCSRDEWLGFDFYDTFADPNEPMALQSEWSRVIAERQAGAA